MNTAAPVDDDVRRIIHDPAFEAACQRYHHANGSSEAIAAAAVRALRAAAALPHPTGSEKFAGTLRALGVPAPWTFDAGEDGVRAANGAIVCEIDPFAQRPDEQVPALAMWIIMAVNTLAGFKAVVVREG